MVNEYWVLTTTIRQYIINSSLFFGERVHEDVAPEGTAYPYAVYTFSGGGDTPALNTRMPTMTLTIKCVSDVNQESIQGAEVLGALLDDTELKAVPLDGGNDWSIINSTKEGFVRYPEVIEGESERFIYHTGYQFVFVMQEA